MNEKIDALPARRGDEKMGFDSPLRKAFERGKKRGSMQEAQWVYQHARCGQMGA